MATPTIATAISNTEHSRDERLPEIFMYVTFTRISFHVNPANMNLVKRSYTQTARAEAARETGDRILAAALTAFLSSSYDDVTLDKVASDAGVTPQTVLRRFGSKEGVAWALADVVEADQLSNRDLTRPGDIVDAVTRLVHDYETNGDTIMHLLRQEVRVAPIAGILDQGRQHHEDWCKRVFAPWLESRTGVDRKRLLATLLATCDVYTWYLLRRQRGLSRRQTELALTELLEGLLT
jgi:AcrR family transcriptional regulator